MNMSNNKIRVTAMIMSVLMILGTLAFVNVSAKENSMDNRAVKFVLAMGIMTEDSYTGTFWDETPVKRAEMAVILCNMFGFEPRCEDAPVFSDVREEERGYVETIVRNGYMVGHGDGTFGANEYVTAEQVIKIFVTVLGAEKVAENIGGYPTGYVKIAKELDILPATLGNLSDKARRIDVANIIYDSMHANVYTLISMGAEHTVYDSEEGETFLSERLNIYTGSGIVSKNEVTSLNRVGGTDEGHVQIGDKLYRDSNRMMDEYFGSDVVVYYKKDNKTDEIGDIIYVEEGKDNEIITIADKDIIAVNPREIKFYDGDKQKFETISPVADMIYNGVAVAYDDSRMKIDCGSVKLVDNSGDGRADVVIIYNYTPYVAEYVLLEDQVVSNMYAADPIVLKDNSYSITKNGLSATLEDISKGDVILAAVSENAEGIKAIKLDICNETVVGEIERTFVKDGRNYITVSGEDFEISEYCKALNAAQYIPTVKAGDAGQFYLDSGKRVIYYSENAFSGGIGYLVDSAVIEGVFSSKLSVKIYTEADKFETYTTADKLIVNSDKMEVTDVVKNADIMAKLKAPQLIQYKVDDGVLSEIVFAVKGYDVNNFSLDFEGTAACNYSTVLNDKYSVSSDTKVFYVPRPNIANDGKGDMLNQKYYYHIYSGTRFGVQMSYPLKMYDIQPNNKVKYVVEQYDPSWGNIMGGSQVLAIDEVGEGINEEGVDVKFVQGINESGNKVTFYADLDYALTDTTLNREVKSGDIIQYVTDFKGYIRGIKIQKDIDDPNYFGSTRMDPGDISQKKAFGEVIYNNSTNILISGTKIHENMLPEETELYISNTGSAVFEYNMERKTYRKIAFSEIVRGEKIFACVNGGNRTRMLVVYR